MLKTYFYFVASKFLLLKLNYSISSHFIIKNICKFAKISNKIT